MAQLQYEEVEIDVMKFEGEDVIVTSCPNDGPCGAITCDWDH